MNEHILPGPPPVRVILRYSARARRYSLRVSRLDGRVTLTLPTGASAAQGISFVKEKERWIRNRLADRPAAIDIDLGTVLAVDGKAMQVVAARRSGFRGETGRIEVSVGARSLRASVAAMLKARARNRLTGAVDRFSGALGRPYQKITLRDPRSRWGSCSASGALMFSWRLILAPPAVLDYVAAHEVAHLAEMNHGPRFWSAVERLWPEYRADRAWLRQHGEELHRYRFED